MGVTESVDERTGRCRRRWFVAVFCQQALGSPRRRGAGAKENTPKLELERIPTKVILDGLKRNMSRGNSLSDELDLSSVLGDTRAYLYSPVWG